MALARRTLPSTPETDLRNMAPTCPQTWYYAMCRPLPPRYFTVFSGVSLLRTCCPYISLAYAPYDPHLALARTCPQHGPRWPQHGFNPGPFPPPPLASGRLPGSLSIHPKLPPKSTIRPSGLVMAEDSGSARSAARTRRRAGAMAAGPPRMSREVSLGRNRWKLPTVSRNMTYQWKPKKHDLLNGKITKKKHRGSLYHIISKGT